ncbi:glycosyltransferase family 2 protein [Demequina pelophila]|uniref:glycosyltransferase family 2 protein n=1 Tax=Demequina pelophila TaxID=1638984 RepID=UPI00138E0436|nr:glycosyltransferase family 2 protein [Demequina pelophila]
MPVLNEQEHLAEAVRSVTGQTGLDDWELILALGDSRDGTDRIAAELAAAEPRIQVLRNPGSGISRGMNLALERATHPVVMRVDAHSVLPPEYAATAIRTMRQVGAVNVGGRMRASGRTAIEKAVAWAYNSPGGLGGAIYHTGGDAGPAESAYLGVFDRAAVLAVGGYDETLSRGEDWDLNRRLIEAGGTVWFEPLLEVVYRPRSSIKAVAKQFHASGRWRGEIIRRLRGGGPVRYLVPPTLVIALAAGAGLVIFDLATGLQGATGAWLTAIGLSPFVVYGAWVASMLTGGNLDGQTRRSLVLVLPTMHLSWGWGCLLGLLFKTQGQNAFRGR